MNRGRSGKRHAGLSVFRHFPATNIFLKLLIINIFSLTKPMILALANDKFIGSEFRLFLEFECTLC